MLQRRVVAVDGAARAGVRGRGRCPGEALRTAAFAAALQRLPVPVVGLPWHQVEHLPDALVIAHEAGASGRRGPRVAPAPGGGGGRGGAASGGWAWAGEAVADVYGAHATGSGVRRCAAGLFSPPTAGRLRRSLQYEPSVISAPRPADRAGRRDVARGGGFAAGAGRAGARRVELAGGGRMPHSRRRRAVVDAVLTTPHPELGGHALGERRAVRARRARAGACDRVPGAGGERIQRGRSARAGRGRPARLRADPATYRDWDWTRSSGTDSRGAAGGRARGDAPNSLAADRATGRDLAELISANGRIDVQAQ